MTSTTQQNWQISNQRYLMAEIERVYRRLRSHLALQQGEPSDEFSNDDNAELLKNSPRLPALVNLCQTCNLSAFERDIILLCAGVELDSSWLELCGAIATNSKQGYPTFELARLVLEDAHWSAFLPSGALRHWQMVEIGAGSTLLSSPLRLDERILHTLLGFSGLDERLASLFQQAKRPNFLVPSHHDLAKQMAATWQLYSQSETLPILQLCGIDRTTKQAIAAQACHLLKLPAYILSSKALPTGVNDLKEFVRLWEREVVLNQVVMILDWDDISVQDAARENGIALLMETLKSPLIIISRDRRPPVNRPVITYDIQNPTRQEQSQLWHSTLTESNPAFELNGFAEPLVTQFNLTVNQIKAAGMQASRASDNSQLSGEESHLSSLWNACRAQARPQLDDLAQRLQPRETWEDLILPEVEHNVLKQIVAHVRQRNLVYEQWGFSSKSARGLGISALFAGVSGTGKTMAAGIVARELQLDLYRIDLSAVVSKYIGETEKNLRRVFDAAETGGVVLLFDEADALFSKRNDVKDSHDRYANMEVSYLLQRMEAYRGLAILTTNLKDSIDPAFLRRIRFITRFEFPSAAERMQIWQRIFPAQLPTEDLNYRKLSKLNIAGGNIRNIALTAAFLAAEEGSAVKMKHLLESAQSEFAKLERPIPPAEVRGWVE